MTDLSNQCVEELLTRESNTHFTLVGDFCCGADDPLNTFYQIILLTMRKINKVIHIFC